MDITIEGFHSWMWRGLSFLLPFLFVGYFFELYNAYALYKLMGHPESEWQVIQKSFFFLFTFISSISKLNIIETNITIGIFRYWVFHWSCFLLLFFACRSGRWLFCSSFSSWAICWRRWWSFRRNCETKFISSIASLDLINTSQRRQINAVESSHCRVNYFFKNNFLINKFLWTNYDIDVDFWLLKMNVPSAPFAR